MRQYLVSHRDYHAQASTVVSLSTTGYLCGPASLIKPTSSYGPDALRTRTHTRTHPQVLRVWESREGRESQVLRVKKAHKGAMEVLVRGEGDRTSLRSLRRKKNYSPAGNRTRVFRVTGGDTHHYTTEDVVENGPPRRTFKLVVYLSCRSAWAVRGARAARAAGAARRVSERHGNVAARTSGPEWQRWSERQAWIARYTVNGCSVRPPLPSSKNDLFLQFAVLSECCAVRAQPLITRKCCTKLSKWNNDTQFTLTRTQRKHKARV